MYLKFTYKRSTQKISFLVVVLASKVHPFSIRDAMGKLHPVEDTNPQIAVYRDLAREALESVAVYNARAQWFERSGNQALANEYLQLSHEALERAQRYKELADLADEQLKRLRFETLGTPITEKIGETVVMPINKHESKRTLKERSSGERTAGEPTPSESTPGE